MNYLIYGAPCSGKSTYVKEHMKKGDLICDLDLIYEAIGSADGHDADLYLHEVATQLQETLYAIIRERKGRWKDAYVITLAHTEAEVQEAKGLVDADECIYIDTPYEVCMERAKERPFYFQWIIQEWFETRDL